MKHTLIAALGATALAFFAAPEEASAHERHHSRAKSAVSVEFYPHGRLAYATGYGDYGYDRHDRRDRRWHAPRGRAHGYWRHHSRRHHRGHDCDD